MSFLNLFLSRGIIVLPCCISAVQCESAISVHMPSLLNFPPTLPVNIAIQKK